MREVSGDNYSVEEIAEGQCYIDDCRWYGKREQACEDSCCVIEFMEKFLEAGFQKEKALTDHDQCCHSQPRRSAAI